MLCRRIFPPGQFLKRFPVYLELLSYNYCTNMNNAYIWFTNGEPKFKCTFNYCYENLRVDRTFNFNRPSGENVGSFMRRVSISLESVLKTKALKQHKKKLKSGKESPEKPEQIAVVVDLLKNGKPVPSDEECAKVLSGDEKLTLHLMGKPYDVVINAPWVTSLSIPKIIMAGCPLYPTIASDSTNIGDSIYTWYLSKNHKDWKEVAKGFMYTPVPEDIGYYVKLICEPKRGYMSGPRVDVTSVNAIEPYPGPCPFDLRHAFTSERMSGNSFRVISYNILAGLYADTETARIDLFRHCPPYAMETSYRKSLLIKELKGYQGDIMCLQEVDASTFKDDLLPIFGQTGYECILHCKAAATREGLVCLAQKSRFRLESSGSVVLMEYLKEDPAVEHIKNKLVGNEKVFNGLIERNSVLQMCVFRSVDKPKEIVVVGNIHLYFHPTADHIRLIQVYLALTRLRTTMDELKKENPDCRVSLIFCGDFNSTPDWGVYRFMTTGSVLADAADWRSREDEIVEDMDLYHPLHLESACGTPEFTNYTIEFKGCLDYIFHETECFEVKQVVPLPTEDDLKEHTALPSPVMPSDHLALVADLAWKPRK